VKTYKQSSVNHQTDIFSDFKSFDAINYNDLLRIQKKIEEWTKNYNGIHSEIYRNSEFINYPPTTEKILNLGGDYLYLELPYEFFNDYLTAWTHDICLKPDSLKCDCYKCNNFKYHLTWKKIKKNILNGIKWITKNKSVASYSIFETFGLGIIKPIYNYSPNWPKIGTHRIAYTSILKSDVPFFFLTNDKDVYIGDLPYFRNKEYCHMKLNRVDKKIKFYISSFRDFDEDRDEKIGEIIYK
jgi:hypothetical protein